MKRLALLSLLIIAVGCGGSSTVDTHVTSGTGATTASTSAGTATTTAGNTGGTSGGCLQNGVVAGAGNGANCCSGAVDANGICYDPSANTTTGAGTTSAAAATGTTVGGTCPSNMPDISSGIATVVDGGACSEFGCPPGFTCVNSQCILNGGGGGLQVTLSWDVNNYEDLDLHVIEPTGGAVWYGDTNRPAGSSRSGAIGSLDRDSNAGCPGGDDGVNIENVIYPASGFPSGTYKVYMDYWANCDGKSSTNYAVQVRANGQIFRYCGTTHQSNADACQQATCGTEVTTFTVP